MVARRAAAGAAAVAVLATSAVLGGCGGAHTRAHSHTRTQRRPVTPPVGLAVPVPVTHGDPISMFSAGAALQTDPAGTLATLRRLGVDRVRLFVSWAALAPAPNARARPRLDALDPAAYSAAGWSVDDAIVRDAAADGIGLDLLIGGPPPRWAAGAGVPRPVAEHPQWEPSAAAFGQFVAAVGTRYSGRYVPPGSAEPLPRVDFWSIWNEPNLGSNLAPETDRRHPAIEVAARYYRRLVDSAWTALGATGHGGDTILIGELGPAGARHGRPPGLFSAMAPLRFLRALYCVGAGDRPLRGDAALARGCPATAAASARFAAGNPGLFHASGLADHPYPFSSLAPDRRTPHAPDDAEFGDIPVLAATLHRLARAYGSTSTFPIWSTEFGYITDPPNPQYPVSPTLAATYLNWAEYLTWRDPRIRSYDQYLLTDSPVQDFATGLRTSTGAEKPTYAAYRMPVFLPRTTLAGDASLDVWGDVRPAKFVPARTRAPAEIQFRANGVPTWATLADVSALSAEGYFDVAVDFPGPGAARIRWTYPDGQAITSRVVSITRR